MSDVIGTIYGDDRVEARITGMADKVRGILKVAMEREWFALQAHVVQDKLSGQVLRRRTGVLASSINVGGADSATEFLESPTELVGRVGTKVWYGRIHEFGGTFEVKEHSRTVDGRESTVKAHTVTFPERSFLRSGLVDRTSSIRDSIQSAVQYAMAQ